MLSVLGAEGKTGAVLHHSISAKIKKNAKKY
jgi:hypothetical protein